MNELVKVLKNNVVVSSLDVAKHFHKRHDNVLRDIEKMFDLLKTEERNSFFFKSTYTDRGKHYPMYYMNRDGFSLLVMGFTGQKALEWKLKYIQAFNHMEKLLEEKGSSAWQVVRAYSKKARRLETDVIKQFLDYAEGQGSKNFARYYTNFSTMADRMLSIGDRNNATIEQLNQLAIVETLIASQIQLGMAAGQFYKDIFKVCKRKAEEHVALLVSVQRLIA